MGVKTRIMETMLLYMVDTLASDFTDIKKMMKDTLVKGKGRWYKAIDEYRIELKLTWKKLLDTDRPILKSMIRLYDTAKWEEGMEKNTSLRFYIQEKKRIHYDLCYRNNRN